MTYQYELYVSHFFSSFLPRNDFTARASNEQQVLKDWMLISASLKNAIIALGALDLTHHSKSYFPVAVAYYKQAVSSLRMQLSKATGISDATIWTSLLLSLFELMFDATGTGFMLHFTKGLPALLRGRTFDRTQIDCHRSLFHAVQMLEVMRAASFWSYDQPALVEDPGWQEKLEGAAGQSIDALEFAVLYALVGRTVSLSNVVSLIVLTVASDDMTFVQQQQLLNAAEQGLALQKDLEIWSSNRLSHGPGVCTPLSLLSSIFHCTLMISITTIFNFPHFRDRQMDFPSVSEVVLDVRVQELCALLNHALRHTNLAGILLLWPLRVAGSRSVRQDQARDILVMLQEIKGRGFAVAQSFEDVLVNKWKVRTFLEA